MFVKSSGLFEISLQKFFRSHKIKHWSGSKMGKWDFRVETASLKFETVRKRKKKFLNIKFGIVTEKN